MSGTGTTELDAHDDHFAAMKMMAAQAGCHLFELADGKYLLCRGSLSRELAHMQAVAELLRALGVKA